MPQVFLYIRGQRREWQEEQLRAEFPQGVAIVDRKPPALLEQLIAEAGPGDMIAATGLEAAPEVTAADYITLCSKGAGLHFQRQPYLDSAIFAPEMGAEDAAASRIIERQLAAAAAARAQQREKEKAGRDNAKAEGRRGGRKPGEHPKATKEPYLKEQIKRYQQQGFKPGQILKAINSDPGSRYTITHNTLYKYMRELEAQDAQEVKPQ